MKPILLLLAVIASVALRVDAAEIAADQRQVAIGYERLETLALRIADAVESTDEARAEQIRAAIGEARTAGLGNRFEKVVSLLERERFTSAREDQTELASQLEELLRLVMADPSESRLEEEKRQLKKLRKEIRAALREQRSLRSRSARGEGAENSERQKKLANRIERLQEPAEEADRLAGKSSQAGGAQSGEESAPSGEAKPGGEKPDGEPQSIAERLRAGEKSMRDASKKLAEESEKADEDQRDAQRELEAAQREAEERLRQLREEEQQRRLATLAERFRRMHESQVGIVGDLESRAKPAGGKSATDRAIRIAASRLADRQSEVGAAAEQALRLVRADGSSLVFDDALVNLGGDIRLVEDRLREARLDATSVALGETVVDALAELIAAVDESLDELEQQQEKSGKPGQGGQAGGASRLVSKIAELRMIRSTQARLLRQTEVWGRAVEAGEADPDEVSERLRRLADEQRRLAAAAQKAAKGGS